VLPAGTGSNRPIVITSKGVYSRSFNLVVRENRKRRENKTGKRGRNNRDAKMKGNEEGGEAE
jgi:hypothetical protein